MVQLPATASSSALETYEKCPRAYRYQYVERLQTAQSVPALTGDLFHGALEHLFEADPADRTMDLARTLIADQVDAAVADGRLAALEVTGTALENLRADLDQLLVGYFTLEDPTTIDVESVEEWFALEMENVRFVGRLDRVDREGGGIVIVDYKTGKLPRDGYEDGAFAGLRRYAMLYEHKTGIAPKALRLHYPRFRVTLDRPIAPRSVVVFKQKAEAAWKHIVRAADADDFPKKPGPLCNWCDFQAFCPGEPPADFPRKSR